MSKPELGKRYVIDLDPSMTTSPGEADVTVAVHYSFKPESFKRARFTDLTVNRISDNATLSVSSDTELKVLKGSLVSDVKEARLLFDGQKFILKPVDILVHSFKQVRGEKYVGEEAKRLNVNSYMKSLSKKKKKKVGDTGAPAATEAAESAHVQSEAPADNSVPINPFVP